MAGDANAPPASEATARRKTLAGRLWRRWGWLVRWSGTVLGVVYVSTLIHVANVKDELAAVSLGVIVLGIGLIALGLVLGAIRWRVTLRAYGARSRPSLGTAVRLYFVAVFYNTYLPGAVGGDIVRAVVARDSFGDHGTVGALAVVFVERALGLFAVCALVITGVLLSGDGPGIDGSLRLGSVVVGGTAALAALLMLPLGRRIARFLPGPLARIASRLPSVVRPFDFVTATLLSLAGQLVVVVAGWLILRDLHPGTTFAVALLIVPAAAATAFLPITVGGTGARETVFIQLGGALLGMSRDAAVAASLLLWIATLIVGAAGGVLILIGRGAAPATPPVAKPAPE